MIELLSLLGGGLAGFLFRFANEYRKDRKEIRQQELDLIKARTVSQDAAAKRVPVESPSGIFVRNIIVLSVVFGLIVAPFIVPFFGLSTIVSHTTTSSAWLLNLIPGTTKIVFTNLHGYYLSEAVTSAFMAIVGFYFGERTAR